MDLSFGYRACNVFGSERSIFAVFAIKGSIRTQLNGSQTDPWNRVKYQALAILASLDCLNVPKGFNQGGLTNSLDSPDLTVVELYLDELRLLFGRATNTIDAYYLDLKRLADELFVDNIALVDATELQLLNIFNRYSHSLSPSSQARAVSSARNFYSFLTQAGIISSSPAQMIEQPKIPALLPGVLSIQDIEDFMSVIDINTPLGLRDRALFELIYGSGLRVSEAINAKLEDLNQENLVMRVTGKGSRTRIVPLTVICGNFLERYITGGSRISLEKNKRINAIFYSSKGTRLTRQAVWQFTKKYACKAQISIEMHPHTLRHSCATHMVNNGADLRVVQELLGHVSVTTTQIYTHVSDQRIAKVYLESHPRAKQASFT